MDHGSSLGHCCFPGGDGCSQAPKCVCPHCELGFWALLMVGPGLQALTSGSGAARDVLVSNHSFRRYGLLFVCLHANATSLRAFLSGSRQFHFGNVSL